MSSQPSLDNLSDRGNASPSRTGTKESLGNESLRKSLERVPTLGNESDSDGEAEAAFVGDGSRKSSAAGVERLSFIDDFSDGIQSYLAYLEQRKKGVIYDRHAPEIRARWREKIASVCKRFRGPPPVIEGPREDIDQSEFSLCVEAAPPSRVHFPPMREFPDGKPRLSFSSCFESGNLALAKTDNPSEYRMLLDFDVNSNGHTQWFYFAVRGGTAGQRVHFSIENMSKPASLFEKGMRPVAWSVLSGGGWKRRGEDIKYFTNNQKRAGGGHAGEGGQYYCTLSFWYTFEYTDDTVFFAYHYPYTYSNLQDFENRLLRHPYASRFLKRSMICLTLSGVHCDALEIGDLEAAGAEGEPGSRKPLAIVTARVHPGEPNASWMVQGFIKFLCSPAPEAQILRERFVWLIVPMLNPDGVIYGNQRCNLSGVDLNRQFSHPDKSLHPTVWHLKDRINRLVAAGHNAEIYLDLHGHSRRDGIFFYGGSSIPGDPRNARIRLLPKLCTVGSDDFSEEGCEFMIQKSKLSTARLVAFLNLNIELSYTIEASFSGAEQRGQEPVQVPTASPVQVPTASPSKTVPDLRRSLEEIASAWGELPKNPSANKDGSSGTADQTGFSSSSRANLDFTQHRLECVGPTVCRALVAALQLATVARNRGEDKSYRSLRERFPILESASELFEGREVFINPALHYNKLSNSCARKVFAQLLAAEEAQGGSGGANFHVKNQDEENEGSDGAPSEDNKSPEQLREVAEAILLRLRRRRSSILDDAASGPAVPREEIRTVVAFGSAFRVPRSQRTNSARPSSARADFASSTAQDVDATATLKPSIQRSGRPQSASSVVGRVHYSKSEQDKSFDRCVESLAVTLPEQDEGDSTLGTTLDELGLSYMHPLVAEDRYDPVFVQRLAPFKQRKSNVKRKLMPARRLKARDAWRIDWVSAQCQKSGSATRGPMPPFLPHRPQWARQISSKSIVEGSERMDEHAGASLPEQLLQLIGNAVSNVKGKSPLPEHLLSSAACDSPVDQTNISGLWETDLRNRDPIDSKQQGEDVLVDELGDAGHFNAEDGFSSMGSVASPARPRAHTDPRDHEPRTSMADAKSGGRELTPGSSTNSMASSVHSMGPLYHQTASDGIGSRRPPSAKSGTGDRQPQTAKADSPRSYCSKSPDSGSPRNDKNPRRSFQKQHLVATRQVPRVDIALNSTQHQSPKNEKPLVDLLQLRPLSPTKASSPDTANSNARVPNEKQIANTADVDVQNSSVRVDPRPVGNAGRKKSTERKQSSRKVVPTRPLVWQHVQQ